ncbi:sodium-dependent glucose transporter 1A-like [Ylistrum balloti]|uniref:sodium-dependent glucose transporter 1A-like n=1 Tax=Ylistrum balloti TaxID=509963 RepID=UPI002905946A|nr:sodium-dependent glucose transporter 1A-like [Ylistrum balloti]
MNEERNCSDGSEHETTSFQESDKEDAKEKSCPKIVDENKSRSFIAELRCNDVTRFNALLSFCVAFAFSMLGWRSGQNGPAFLDLIRISGTDLERGSVYRSVFFAGNILGSIFGGVFYSKVNKYLMLMVSFTTNTLLLALIPWCFHYESMLTVHAFHGICNGVMSVVLSAIAVAIWGATARGRVYLNIFYASFSAAGLISPVITSPFLLATLTDVPVHVTLRNSSNIAGSEFKKDDLINELNMSSANYNIYSNSTRNDTPTSNIFIAYSISAGLSLISTVPFIILYFKAPVKNGEGSFDKKSKFIQDHLPLTLKVLQVVNIGIFSMLYMSLNFTLGGYLATFCVQHMRWTKASGAWLTSVLFLAMLGGRIGGAYLSLFFKPLKMLVLSTVLHAAGLVGLSLSGILTFDVGIWVSVCVIGIALSLMWPSLTSWTNENLLPVRGRMVTYLMLTGFLGALLSPLLFGYMMEEISTIWFCFLSLAKAVGTIINVILMFVYTQYLRRKRTRSEL